MEIFMFKLKQEVPVYLNKEQKDLLERFRKIENEKSNPSIKKFFRKPKVFGIVKNELRTNYSNNFFKFSF